MIWTVSGFGTAGQAPASGNCIGPGVGYSARGLSQVDAEEIRDECMRIVSEKIGRFEYDRRLGGFKNWLRRIASNKIIDLLRKRRTALPGSTAMRRIPSPDKSPDEIWEEQWVQRHLKHCVAEARRVVPAEKSQVFQLLSNGISVREVCSRLGLNANQVYKRKFDFLQIVRKLMNELDVEMPPA